MITSDNRAILAGVSSARNRIPAGYLDERWWPMSVKRRVEAMLPSGVSVTVREEPMRLMLFVELSESRWRRLLRLVPLGSMSRAGVLVRVACELADAPAGVAVSTRWADSR